MTVSNLGFGPELPPAEEARLDLLRLQFFAAMGQCLTAYQQIEDSLQVVFGRALTVGPSVANELWEVVSHRGLEMKLDMVTAALSQHAEDLRSGWKELKNDIKTAQEDRNDIAHATSANADGLMFYLIHHPASPPPSEAKSSQVLVKQQRRGKPPKTIYDSHLTAYKSRLSSLSLRLAEFSVSVGPADWPFDEDLPEEVEATMTA